VVIDSQSVRAADTVPKASRGWDHAKKVNGRMRHIAVDTMGLVLAMVITAASVQDRDGARPLLWNLHPQLPQGPPGVGRRRVHRRQAHRVGHRHEDDHRGRDQTGPPRLRSPARRWVVERTFAWISKHRRTVRDYEQLASSHEAMILWAMIALMTRRLTQTDELPDAH
jgi:transposase